MDKLRIRSSGFQFSISRFLLVVLFAATHFAVLSGTGSRLSAEEPAQRFLDELRANHYYDVALDYLDQMQTSPLAPDSFRARIPLEKANTMMSSIARMRDPRKREAALDQAQATLEDFLKTNPASDLRSMAERTRANLLVARAGMIIEKTKTGRLTADRLVQLREQARGFLVTAGDSFEKNRETIRKEIERLGKPTVAAKKAELENLRDEYVIVRRVSPSIKEKVADTFAEGSVERRKLLEEAAKEFADIYDDYSNRAGGLDAALFACRCYAKLGKYDDALNILTLNIFSQDQVPAFYEFKKRGALIGLTCWESKDPLPANAIIQYLTPIIQDIRPEDKKKTDWLRLQLGFAKACKLKSDSIRKVGAKSPADRRTMNEAKKVAIDLARFVSKSRGKYRDEARALLVKWNLKIADVVEQKELPKTVSEARDRARDEIAEIEDIGNEIKAIKGRIEAGDGDVDQLKNQRAVLHGELDELAQQALKTLELGLDLVDDQTPADDVSFIRYLQAYCYYRREQYLETAIIGRFLMDRHPDKPGAREAMGLVCKSYWQMYNAAPKDDQTYELSQLAKNCSAVIDRWPGSAEAENAAQLMTIVSLKSGDAISAEKFINLIPESSPTRIGLTLNVGQSVWQDYVRKRKAGGGDELFELRDRAKKYLEDGAVTLQVDLLSAFQARCLLSLTELYLDEGNIEVALDRLEKADIALLDLIKQQHPAAQSSTYRLDTYRAAVRAYLGALRTGKNSQDWIEKSQNIIDALGQEFESREDGQKKLVSVYYRLADELKSQFDTIEDPEQKKSFGAGLDVFLSGIAKNAQDNQVLIWCGSTMSNVGESLFEANAKELGRKMFEQAINVFDRVSDASEIPPNTRLVMLRRKALAYRGMERYQKAIDTFTELLSDPQNQKYIDLQIDVAETFQAWGIHEKDEKALLKAVSGGIVFRDPKTNKNKKAFFGWKQITNITQRSRNKNAAKKQLFFKAIYNYAICKYEYAKLTSNNKVMLSAQKMIDDVQKQYPDSGGIAWKPKLDALLRRIKGNLK